MTNLQIFGAIWPFIVLGLFVMFGRFLLRRDLADLQRSQEAARQTPVKEAAE